MGEDREPTGLLGLLDEASPAHAGRSAAETARLRAEALLSLGASGLPDAALPFVVEELESGSEPLLVAAAARAARGRRPVDPRLTRPLLQALRNLAERDDTVSFGSPRPAPGTSGTTPLSEILATLRELELSSAARDELRDLARREGPLFAGAVRTALEDVAGPAGHCCGGGMPATPALDDGRQAAVGPVPREVEVEDQDGRRLALADFFGHAPTVVAFFYTRCDNPRKCSLTITSLAELCRDLADRLGSVQVAAVTYDPGFDIPARLRRYGSDRGLPFGPAVRMFRTVAGWDLLRAHFGLRVGYTASVVNRHGIELFLLDGGRVVRIWSRTRWAPADVARQLGGAR
ncbi:Cytochrome oxidase Cu insertion factor, SCO1/SenC/PrrC family [Geodermatophilus pulveris]|uniref:Cytochrome oxidase Cu insertion factor, SCO1/SenC/PrrC family n=1 Tax=Geodermatophilus pulveris TaxID=1564159 RepID=A0A239C4P9_9ACTN|nr:SCO family protein [Geodermatophilus pulveris]SNS14621.1 Cytochrome oxidase Cu insertion factor, SCO1/SenC/PrrC family [Geodermatophilus pulveris]